MLLPSYTDWHALIGGSIRHRLRPSRQWRDLDAAYRAYCDTPSSDNYSVLKNALVAFDARHRHRQSQRDSQGAITALRRTLNLSRTYGPADIEAARAQTWDQRNCVFAALANLSVQFKRNAKQRIKDEISGEVTAIANVVASNIHQFEEAVESTSRIAWDLKQRMLGDLAEGYPAELRQLTEELLDEFVSEELLSQLASAIPVLGTIVAAKEVLEDGLELFKETISRRAIGRSERFVTNRSLADVIQSLRVLLDRRRNEIRGHLAASTVQVTAGIATGGLSDSPISLARAIGQLLYKIGRTINECVKMVEVNRKLRTLFRAQASMNYTTARECQPILLDAMHEFPLLAAYVVAILGQNTFAELVVSEVPAAFEDLLSGLYDERFQPLVKSATALLEDSHFMFVERLGSRVDVEAQRRRELEAEELQREFLRAEVRAAGAMKGADEDFMKSLFSAALSEIPRAAEQATERRHRREHQARFQPILDQIPDAAEEFAVRRHRMEHHDAFQAALNEISVRNEKNAIRELQERFTAVCEDIVRTGNLLELLVLANDEIEREARCLIDLRRHEKAIACALRFFVSRVIVNYDAATKSVFSRPSRESLAAIERLSDTEADKLECLVKHLLNIVPSVAFINVRPLGVNSRLYAMLQGALQSFEFLFPARRVAQVNRET